MRFRNRIILSWSTMQFYNAHYIEAVNNSRSRRSLENFKNLTTPIITVKSYSYWNNRTDIKLYLSKF